jgi:hypothetical protein
MHTRNGKIARLPRPLREELNRRLDQAAQSPELLDWLNNLPEVKSILARYFGGSPITKQNLSRWRRGGFQETILRRELLEESRAAGKDLQEAAGPDGFSGVAAKINTVLAAHYGRILMHWNGAVNTDFSARVQTLNSISGNLARLQRASRLDLGATAKMRLTPLILTSPTLTGF